MKEMSRKYLNETFHLGISPDSSTALRYGHNSSRSSEENSASGQTIGHNNIAVFLTRSTMILNGTSKSLT